MLLKLGFRVWASGLLMEQSSLPERKVPSVGRPDSFPVGPSGASVFVVSSFCLCCSAGRLAPTAHVLTFDFLAVLSPGALGVWLCVRRSFLVTGNSGNTGDSDLDSSKAAVHAGRLGHSDFHLPHPKVIFIVKAGRKRSVTYVSPTSATQKSLSEPRAPL